MSGGLSEFLLTEGAKLLARNSRAAEFPQAAADLAAGVLTWIPRPVARRQRDRQDTGSQELQQHMSEAQEQGPAAYALARAALIVPQPQFFDFIEVDFNLAATRIGMDGLHGIKGQVGTQQVPGREGKPGDSDQEHAGRQPHSRP